MGPGAVADDARVDPHRDAAGARRDLDRLAGLVADGSHPHLVASGLEGRVREVVPRRGRPAPALAPHVGVGDLRPGHLRVSDQPRAGGARATRGSSVIDAATPIAAIDPPPAP